MANGPVASVENAILAAIEGVADDAELDLLRRQRPTQLVRGCIQLLQNLLDHLNNFELSGQHGDFVRACDEASLRFEAESGSSAHLIAGLLAFVGLNAELLKRRFEPPDPGRQAESDKFCTALFERGPIRQAVHALYAPEGFTRRAQQGEDPAAAEWRRLDPDTLRYFKAGTTSAILVGRQVDQTGLTHGAELVVKCVLFPWNKMAAVAQATESYAAKYGRTQPPVGSVHDPDDPVVRPTSSTKRWVIMPLQHGETLRDYLLSRTGSVEPAARIRIARDVSSAVVAALARLGEPAVDGAESGRPPGYPAVAHLDLSPSNIIMTRDGIAKLIDLGLNHLYSRQVGIAEHDDSVYIAPEVKNRGSSPTADVYSLGMILIEVLAGQVNREGRVSDSIYEMSPTLGRALDDLIDEDPHRRLLLLPDGAAFSYQKLGNFLDEAFELTKGEPVASDSRWKRGYAKFAPASRELSTQFHTWRAVQERPGSRNAGYLLFFSLVASVSWWFIFIRTAAPALPDLIKSFPALPTGMTVAAMIAFGQGIMAAKYYQTVLARFTLSAIPGTLARTTEVMVRLMTIVAVPTCVLTVNWKPWLWAWSAAVGALLVALTNLMLVMIVSRLFRLGRQARLSTVPPADREFPRGFEQWWWTMLLYAVMIGAIAAGLQSGKLVDENAYVFGLLTINIGIHYIAKCAIAGWAVRGGLVRACVVGERLAVLHRRKEPELGEWPPRLLPRQRTGSIRTERTGPVRTERTGPIPTGGQPAVGP